MRRSNDLARRLIVLMRRDSGVRINHGQEKRGADYERKYVLISLGERHLRAGKVRMKLIYCSCVRNVSTASAMLEASSLVA